MIEYVESGIRTIRADLTGRYTNNEIKRRQEKIVTLIEDLQRMDETQLGAVNSEAYFGSTTDASERTELLEQELAMRTYDEPAVVAPAVAAAVSHPDASVVGSVSPEDGHEYLSILQEAEIGITEIKRLNNGKSGLNSSFYRTE